MTTRSVATTQRGTRGARGRSGAQGKAGPRGRTGPAASRAEILATVGDRLGDINKQLATQLKRMWQIQAQLDLQARDAKMFPAGAKHGPQAAERTAPSGLPSGLTVIPTLSDTRSPKGRHYGSSFGGCVGSSNRIYPRDLVARARRLHTRFAQRNGLTAGERAAHSSRYGPSV